MRLTAIILLSACLTASAAGHTQTVTLNFKKAPLEKVLTEIKKQTGYSIFYNYRLIDKARPVTISVKNAGIEDVMKACLKDQALDYEIADRSIVIKEKSPNVNADDVMLSEVEARPPIDIHGRVVNEKGEPVAASVQVKGTGKGTTTNDNGEFELKGVDDNATLIISGVSIESFEVKVNGRSELALGAKIKTNVGQEVTVEVNTGYQRIPKERATGSFSTVDKKQFDQRTSVDVISRLEGITSGLVFNKQGLLGTPELSIRGRSTIFANDQPLIVVDNFPYDGDISNINPSDVENITVLKDAAAASIWGVRAGNGVIVITTKKGNYNQPLKIQLNTNYTLSEKPDLSYNPNFIGSKDFIELEKFLFQNGYYDANLSDPTFPVISPVVKILNAQRNGQLTSAQANSQINSFTNNDVRNDIGKFLYRNGFLQQHHISLTAGGNNINYLLSVGYDKNNLTNIDNYYDRLTINSSASSKITKNLELQLNANYINSTFQNDLGNSNISTGGKDAKAIYPYAQFKDAQGNILNVVKNYSSSLTDSAERYGFLNWQYAPLKEIGLRTDHRKMTDIRFVPSLKYDFTSWLSAELRYQYEQQVTDGRTLSNRESFYVRNMVNTYASVSQTGMVTKLDNIPIGGILDLSNSQLRTNSIRGQIDFARKWKANSINAIAGVEAREIVSDISGNRLYGYDDQYGTFQLVAQPTSQFPLYPSGTTSYIESGTTLGQTTDRFRSWYSNASYSYKERYTFSASGRIDQSNFFGVKTNQRSVPLWSAGVKWDVGKEQFFDVSAFRQLSLRATYGFNGNLDKSLTALTTFLYFSNPANFTGAKIAGVNNFGNSQLRWEKTGMVNIGLDFGVKKFLTGSIDWYSKKGIDLVGDAIMPPSSGVLQFRGNYANTKGSGIDVVLNSTNINREFKWTTNFLLSHATDKVTKYSVPFAPSLYLAANGNTFDKIPVVGNPLYSVFALRWAGLDPNTGDPRGYVADTISKNYSLLNYPPSSSDVKYVGPARPTFFGAINNSFSYNGIMITASITYKLGYYFRRTSINYDYLYKSWVGNSDFSNRWQKPGDEAKTNVPSMVYPSNPQRDLFYANSAALVDKGDHIRFQYVSIGYELNRRLLKSLPVQSIQLFGLINNLGIIWRANNEKIDPDFQSPYGGNDAVSIPPSKSYSIGLKAIF